MSQLQITDSLHAVSDRSRFRWAYDRNAPRPLRYYDQPLLESEDFVVIPTLGPLVPGWVLIVPKLRLQRFSNLPTHLEVEFITIARSIRDALKVFEGDFFLFEHGSKPGSPASCGVEQAHMHALILKFDLISMSRSQSRMNWNSSSKTLLPAPVNSLSEEYLFASDGEASILTTVNRPVSQWFRRLIATSLGRSQEWDYRAYQFHHNISKTIRTFSSYAG